jgi:hypothetical protein
MTGLQEDLLKDGPGAFEDAVVLELCHLGSGSCAYLRLACASGGARMTAAALVLSGGEVVARVDEQAPEPGIESWSSASAGGISIETVEPGTAWHARLESGRAFLDASFEAVAPAIDFQPAGPGNVQRRETLCRVRGTLRVDGEPVQIESVGRHARVWGDPAGARIRSLYAVGEGRAVTAAAILPADTEGHGAEHVSAFLVMPDSPPEPFEDVRLSTVYDSAGRPRTAGLELFMAGDEYPRRVSGEAVCAAEGAPNGAAACFRWSLDGDPAAGGYRIGQGA